MKTETRLFARGDLFIYIILVLLLIVLFLLPLRHTDAPLTAQIIVDGEVSAAFQLASLSQEKSLTVHGCVIVLACDGVYVADADCPDQFCVKRKKISHAGESIACVPNRVVVTLENEDIDLPYDAVAY